MLFEQDTPGQFVDVTVISGIDRSLARGGYGTAWVDYDGDGDLDLFRTNLNGRNTLFRNNSTAINWLAAELLSVESATKPIAAQVVAWVAGVPQYRNVNGEYNVLPVHFGLGASTTVDSLIVEWPSGRRHLVGQPDGQYGSARRRADLRRRAGHQRRSAADAGSGLQRCAFGRSDYGDL